MHDIMRLIQANYPSLTQSILIRISYTMAKIMFLAAHGNEYVGAIVCKLDMYMNKVMSDH
ncbi:N-alpha-acetyltransferase 30 [Lucilia cuprina]|nr:N-alpha-acetyltransferase 30 [Lucilia cuprina]